MPADRNDNGGGYGGGGGYTSDPGGGFGGGGGSYPGSSVGAGDILYGVNIGNGDVQIDRVDCFLQGTRILTPNGEMAVEALPTGDAVLTQSGAVQPIRYCNAHEQAHGNGTPHAEKIHYVCERQYRWTPVWAAS
jgi:hypothetical protein